MKKGLVLEGGALRGLFTAGILDVMLENEIVLDGVVGVSAGAVFGCNYKSRQIGRTIRYNKKYCADPRYCGFGSLICTGDFYNAKFDYEEIPLRLDPFDCETFVKNPVEFHVVATDADTGKAVYHVCTDGGKTDIEWLRASASMPGLSNLVCLEGKRLSDGGTADSVPLEYFEKLGYDRCMVITTQPKGYRKEKNALLPLLRVVLRKTPHLWQALADRHLRYNAQMDYIDRREESGEVLVIRPAEKITIRPGERDPEKLEAVYQLGRRAGEAALDKIRTFFSE